jgi:cytochrome o ubiquinol oxidase subunit 2
MTKRKTPVVRSWHMLTAIIVAVLAAGVGLWAYLQGKNIAVLNPQGPVGLQERNLIVFTLLLSLIVVIPVFIMLGAFAWRYRESNTKAKYTPDFDSNKWLEGLWWGIPVVIIGILIVVTWVSTYQLNPSKSLASTVKPLHVQVIALQWRWLFLYPDQQVATLGELKIPPKTPVDFDITADAPMSAFWIPSLGTQTYAMTGMTSHLNLEADHPGTYRGTNSNINGKGYADMNFTVTVMPSTNDFNAWAKEIPAEPFHSHLADDEYAAISKPSTDETVEYFHLHDTNLFNEVLSKYNGDGSMTTTSNDKSDD